MEPLPTELWTKIFKILSRRDLPSLSKTCVTFRVVAQSILYEDIYLKVDKIPEYEEEDSSEEEYYDRKHSLFSRSITERPMLASLVRNLTLEAPYSSRYLVSHPALPQLASFSNIRAIHLLHFQIGSEVCDALQSLPHLNVIHFDFCRLKGAVSREYSQRSWRSTSLDMTLTNPAFEDGWAALMPADAHSLTVEMWDTNQEETRLLDLPPSSRHSLKILDLYMAAPADIIPFLMSCPQLRRITLPYCPPDIISLPPALSPNALPLLDTYIGPAEYAETFIKNRPVRTASINFGDHIPRLDVLQSLGSSTVPLTKLELFHREGNMWGEFSATFMHHIPTSLIYFGFGIQDSSMMLDWLPVLSKFPSLRVIRGMCVDEEHSEVVHAASEACSSLEKVVFDVVSCFGSRVSTWVRGADGTWKSNR